jgi:hypothetical protein
MKKKATLLILAAIAIVLAITNLSIDSHKEAVEQKLYSQSDISKVTDADLDSFNKVGYALADGAIFSVIDSMVVGISRDNYILFSLTKATYEGNSRYRHRIIG